MDADQITKPLTPLQQERRERILDEARALFDKGGIHATGVDAVMRAAGVSKKTLYKYYGSKTGLVLAVLAAFVGQAQTQLQGAAAKAGGGMAAIEAIFSTYAVEDPQAKQCGKGCFALHVLAEYSGHEPEVAAAARAFKQWERTFLTGLAADAGATDSAEAGAALLWLLDGAMAQQAAGMPIAMTSLHEMLAGFGISALS